MPTRNKVSSGHERVMKIVHEVKDILWRSGRISLELYKIMIPIIIAVKILQELGLIAWLALPLAPIMQLVGLPGRWGWSGPRRWSTTSTGA